MSSAGLTRRDFSQVASGAIAAAGAISTPPPLIAPKHDICGRIRKGPAPNQLPTHRFLSNDTIRIG